MFLLQKGVRGNFWSWYVYYLIVVMMSQIYAYLQTSHYIHHIRWRSRGHQAASRSWNRNRWGLFKESRLRNTPEVHRAQCCMHHPEAAAKLGIGYNEKCSIYLKFVEWVYFSDIKDFVSPTINFASKRELAHLIAGFKGKTMKIKN